MLIAAILLSATLTQVMQQDVVAGERICDASGLRTFYTRRDGRAAWDAATAASLLRSIDRLAEDGRQPDRYHRQALVQLEQSVEREVLATDAFLLAVTHLSRGV